MPDEFVLECLTAEGDWIDWGLYRAEDFERQEDGAYRSRARGAHCGSGACGRTAR